MKQQRWKWYLTKYLTDSLTIGLNSTGDNRHSLYGANSRLSLWSFFMALFVCFYVFHLFKLWVRLSVRTHGSYVKRVNTLSKVVGGFRVLWIPPTGNIDRVGWDKSQTIANNSIVAVLRGQTWVIGGWPRHPQKAHDSISLSCVLHNWPLA
jgi:hypothetical protein